MNILTAILLGSMFSYIPEFESNREKYERSIQMASQIATVDNDFHFSKPHIIVRRKAVVKRLLSGSGFVAKEGVIFSHVKGLKVGDEIYIKMVSVGSYRGKLMVYIDLEY
jgi:hypothetical protein